MVGIRIDNAFFKYSQFLDKHLQRLLRVLLSQESLR